MPFRLRSLMMTFSVLFLVSLATVALAQPGRGGPFGGNMFGDGPPPPGAVSILGRSMITTMYNGSSNSMFLMGAVDNENFRKELGMTDDQVNAMRQTRNEIGFEAMTKMAPLVERFKNMTPEDQPKIEADLVQAFDGYRLKIEGSVPEEMLGKARVLNFQAMGGLDSPMLNMDMISTLDLDDAQKEKAQKILKDMEAERAQNMEDGFALFEKAIAKGKDMTDEDRAALETEARAMMARTFALSKKLGDNVRGILTDTQKKRAENLMATRPDFLGPLPKEMRGEEEGAYKPGEDSWKPGEGAPGPGSRIIESVFPTE